MNEDREEPCAVVPLAWFCEGGGAQSSTERLPPTRQIKIGDIHELEMDDLAHSLKVSEERAKFIKALATFQQIPSIGHQFADTLVDNLGFHSLGELKGKDGAILLDQLERDLGHWVDPCVEDQIRCVIHHANHPGSTKQWFDFTKERKAYRESNGYPKTRPEKPFMI